tara:strand:+ start:214 stop:714 length:501 start_codon:yes stop_codon:yes gene_type:complete
MANRVEYAVSATPVRTIAGDSGKYAAQDVIEGDINKTLGGSASTLVVGTADITVQGFQAGVVAYGNCPASGQLPIGTANTAYEGVFIKHTGKQWGGSATVLGDASTATNLLIVEVEKPADTFITICKLEPGGAIYLPNTVAQAANCTFQVSSSASETIAVEFATIT